MSFVDNSDDYNTRMAKACEQALNKIGLQAVSHAKVNITKEIPRNGGNWKVKGNPRRTTLGALRNSISHYYVKAENAVYIGTNMSYAIYNEYGTGIYAENGTGKKGFWVFVPGEGDGRSSVGSAKVYTEGEAKRIVAMLQSKGIDAHMTNGIKPIHFLKRALEDHKEEYLSMIQDSINYAMNA